MRCGVQGISFRLTNTTPLATDMIVSNEPGYYEDGKFGVRIENLAFIVEAKTAFNFAGATSPLFIRADEAARLPLQADERPLVPL